VRDIVGESLLALTRRTARTYLSMLGSLLGVAVLAASLTMTASARAQVDRQFEQLRSTRVTISREGGGDWLDPSRLAAVRSLPGVRAVGVMVRSSSPWQVSRLPSGWTGTVTADVVRGGPELFSALQARLVQGRTYDHGHLARGDRVVIVGQSLAKTLGVDVATGHDVIYLAGQPYRVIGTIGDTAGSDASLLLDVFVPPSASLPLAGTPSFAAPQVVLDTRRGWTDRVAEVAPLAVHPEGVEDLEVEVAASPQRLRAAIGEDVQSLLMALGAVTLLIGAVSIGNTTLMTVLERRADIGLRRALGASRTAILLQILVEAALTGLVGGVVGAVVGELITVVVAAVVDWPARIDLRLLPGGALLGMVTGAAAGIYPALRAAGIQPADALRG